MTQSNWRQRLLKKPVLIAKSNTLNPSTLSMNKDKRTSKPLSMSHVLDIKKGLMKRRSFSQVDAREGRSLFELLHEQPFRDEFYDFLCSNMCAENLLFYEAVERWRKLEQMEERRKMAVVIFHNFVAETACQQVNVSSSARKRLAFEVTQEIQPISMFDLAAREITLMLQLEMFPKFSSTFPPNRPPKTYTEGGRNSLN